MEYIKLVDVCKELFAGGDIDKKHLSFEANEDNNVPIYTNGEENAGLYGYTNKARVSEVAITISARGTIGYSCLRTTPFYPAVRLIVAVPDTSKIKPKFLLYYINSKKYGGRGASIPQLTIPMLKNEVIPLFIMQHQKEIVSILDKINAIIDADKKQLELLDETVKSRFIEMFEGKSYPILKWNDVFNTKTGKLDSNAMVEGGQYPFFTCAKEIFAIDKYAFDQEALLLAGNNAAGKYDVKYYKGKFNAYQRTYVLDLKQNWSYQLFKYQLEDKLEWLREQSKGCNTRYITLKILAELEFVIPPIELQNEFELFVKQIDKSKFNIQQHLNLMQELLDKKTDEYFGG